MRLALGTAQFGLDYGISNAAGRVAPAEVARVLDAAESAGVRLLDTAPVYGQAEAVLGGLGAARRFAVITKTARLGPGGVAAVEAEFSASLARLRAESVHGLLVHRAADLLGPEGPALAALLARLRAEGRVACIGVSAYAAEELDAALAVLDARIVQVPVNVLDQRLVRSGALARWRARGIEVHARSAFLQGLLLMEPAQTPAYFAPIRGRLEAWRAFCGTHGLTPLEGALRFVAGLAEVDAVVCGVESVDQLRAVAAALHPPRTAGSPAARPLATADFADLVLDQVDYLDPSRWRVTS